MRRRGHSDQRYRDAAVGDLRGAWWRCVYLAAMISLSACQPVRSNSDTVSVAPAGDSGSPTLDLAAAKDILTWLQALAAAPEFRKTVAATVEASLGDYRPVAGNASDIGSESFAVHGRRLSIDTKERERVRQADRARASKAQRSYASVGAYLKAQAVPVATLQGRDLAQAFLALLTLTSGREDNLAGLLGEDSLGLVDLQGSWNDFRHLARLGAQAITGKGSVTRVVASPQTWDLVHRHREILQLALDTAGKINPGDPRLARYQTIMDHMVTASKIMLGIKRGQELMPYDVSAIE